MLERVEQLEARVVRGNADDVVFERSDRYGPLAVDPPTSDETTEYFESLRAS